MKIKLLSLIAIAAAALASSASAEVSTKLSNVHLCCTSCVKGVAASAGKVAGAKLACDKDAGTVSVTAADAATVQKAVDALVGAGYFGSSSNPDIKLASPSGAKDETVKSLKVAGVHLCCGKCVKAVNDAVKSVKGVTGTTAEKNAESFDVTGEFNATAVFTALEKAGLTGKAK
jgi:copper chaperone CopZ